MICRVFKKCKLIKGFTLFVLYGRKNYVNAGDINEKSNIGIISVGYGIIMLFCVNVFADEIVAVVSSIILPFAHAFAGGKTENADIDRVNLAKHLIDGTEVIVPNVLSRDSDYGEKVNINTANESRLQNINGVGEATAEKIIKYREENGGFNSIEEIMNIEGIGLKTFETMKEYICIN
jgi:comEA protein